MAKSKRQIEETEFGQAGRSMRVVRDKTLADSVYERILGMIVDGTIAVGEKMPSEHELCRVLDVSRPVLRQALKQLRSDEVIVSRQGSGSYVIRRPERGVFDFAPVGSVADIQRTFEFRAAVEGEAAFLAAQRRSETDLAHLETALRELDRCIESGELGVEADEAFHVAICEASHNRYFAVARTAMKENILTGMNLTRNLSLTKSRERLELVQREHYAIMDAVRAQDPDTARMQMRAHVENARKRVFEGSPAEY